MEDNLKKKKKKPQLIGNQQNIFYKAKTARKISM